MLDILQIQKKVQMLAEQIQAPEIILPTFGYSRNNGTPHVEVDDLAYYYINLDRNIKTVNRKTPNLNLLLYWIFVDITATMSSNYAKTHSNPKVDSRKIRFEHQLRLLERIDQGWKEHREQEIAEILRVSPYRDV